MMTAFNAAAVLAGGTVLFLGVVGGYVKNRLWMAETTICLLVGAAVGPAVLDWVRPPDIGVDQSVVLREVARFTLAMAVMGAALRLPSRFELRHMAGIALMLGLVLPLMWLAASGLASLFFGYPLLVALMIGAALAPTDPVVAGSIAGSKLASTRVAGRLRHLLTAESGANDGLGLLFVMLPVLLATEPPSEALREWLVHTLVWEIGAAVGIGIGVGWITGRLLAWAYRQPFSEHHSLITIGLALSITVVAAVGLIGSDGILAVFVAGLMLNRFVTKQQTRHEHVQEAIGRFFDLPVFVLLGVMLPWSQWSGLGWAGIGFALAVLLLRRLPWLLATWRLVPEIANRREAAFLGWFGPMGIASIYYAIVIEQETGNHDIWPIVSLVVFVSVIAHGISATPFTAMMGGGRDRDRNG